MREPHELPREIDTRLPNNARVCDYVVGGKDNFAADRRAAHRLVNVAPETRRLIPEGHAFRARALRLPLAAGVRQFLDVGCGMPTRRDVHDIVREAAPEAAVAYADLDPMVVSHRQAMSAGPGHRPIAVQADVRAPETIVKHPEIADLLDFGEPVGLLLTGVLHLVGDEDDPWAVVAAFRDALAPGSYLVLSDLTDEFDSPGMSPQAWIDKYLGIPLTLRNRDQLVRYFDGFEVLEPGLVDVLEWRPDGPHRAPTGLLVGGVGVRR
ncbi:SAM-dependent methyltransferase [Actinomadura craniellae]|uniref:SAM-dependent methyltransferase n=1 Tax=Actinomadura craniellae TaxID=2231787 RepID=UPI001314558A|nr:SAM-dependent methyltransferase [Actinomadura craniellae]